MEKLSLEIAAAIGSPIDPNLPVPFILSEIADVVTAKAGETCYTFDADSEVDYIVEVAANGAITTVKIVPNSVNDLTFKHLNSKREYVLVTDVMDSKDQTKIARGKRRIARSMDKTEVKRIIDAALACQEIEQVTPEDLYDMIVKMKHAIEDYGNNFVLLCGSGVKEAIDTYNKDRAEDDNYNTDLQAYLDKAGIKVIKVSGLINSAALLATNKAILIALDSTFSVGRPIVFVRREIPAEVAKAMGFEIDTVAQRGLINEGIVNVGGTDTLGYGYIGYESVIEAVINPYAICWATIV